MDLNTFKTFINPTILKIFIDPDSNGINHEDTLNSCLNVAVSDYNNFVIGIQKWNGVFRYSSDSYILKKAFSLMYEYILQDKALLKNVSLTGLNVADGDIYEHFLKLKSETENELNTMIKDCTLLLLEIEDIGRCVI